MNFFWKNLEKSQIFHEAGSLKPLPVNGGGAAGQFFEDAAEVVAVGESATGCITLNRLLHMKLNPHLRLVDPAFVEQLP